jgi:hypothetical protein
MQWCYIASIGLWEIVMRTERLVLAICCLGFGVYEIWKYLPSLDLLGVGVLLSGIGLVIGLIRG